MARVFTQIAGVALFIALMWYCSDAPELAMLHLD